MMMIPGLWSMLPDNFDTFVQKKTVYPQISEGTLRVFYILERSSINYLKKKEMVLLCQLELEKI